MECQHVTEARREATQWDALPTAVLIDAQIDRCTRCGARGLLIPAMHGLLDLATRTIAAKATRLAGAEVRFLRGMIDLERPQLAALLGSDAGLVWAWEEDREPIGRNQDLLLRALALMLLDGAPLPASAFVDLGAAVGPPVRYAFAHDGEAWRLDDPARHPACWGTAR